MANLTNYELVTLATYLVGGDVVPAETEDIAVKVNELAPGRFTWRKYPDQINIEVVRAFLSDAKKPKYGAYLSGTGTKGWLLTPDGLAFCKANVGSVATPAAAFTRLSRTEKAWIKKEKIRLLSSDAFAAYERDGIEAVRVRAAQGVFRLSDYIEGDAREEKVRRLTNALGADADVGEAVRAFAKLALGES